MAMTALLMCLSANAFEFDGIDLNGNAVDITRQISAKGYIYNEAKNCLVGNCQGTDIELSINLYDVSQRDKIGQLIVNVPMTEKNAFVSVAQAFNVIYHQTQKTDSEITYQVSNDGTQLVVAKTADGIRLTYNTPYYKVR